MRNERLMLLAGTAYLALSPLAAMAQDAPTTPEVRDDSETIVVTGVRGRQPRTVTDSPVPVDILTAEQLRTTDRFGLKEVLGTLVPSFSLPSAAGGGTATSVRPYSIRGLSGDYLLVLVNGKRRHTTALISNISRVAAGSAPVDLDLIPISGIKRIEVLRDGAAAQYGSDAIAGIINIGLSEADSGLRFNATAGQTYASQGEQYTVGGDVGFKLGNDGGFLNIAVDARDRHPATNDELATGNFYPLLAGGVADPRESTANRNLGLYGRPYRERLITGSYNLAIPLGDVAKLYSFSTLSRRKILDPRQFYRPNTINALPERYPDGFLPRRKIDETDFQATAGVKGDLGPWAWDLSSTYGRDYAKLGGDHTLNPSLGPTNTQSSFDIGTQIFKQWTNNLDLGRAFDAGLYSDLQLSLGLEHRWEQFENRAGEPNSYLNGGYIIPVGTSPFSRLFGGRVAPAGLVAFTGTTPDDAVKISRNSYAAYVELGADVAKGFFVGVAARAEHYDDSAGDTISGKISARYEILPGFAIRGGVNSGFRAPSLAQIGFSTTQNIGIVQNDGSMVQVQSKFLPVNSAQAVALGAEPLKPEKSRNFTGGFTYEYDNRIRVTLDAYQINIDDRLARTENLQGAAVQRILAAQGFNDLQTAQYFANAINTRTRGVDFVAEYTRPTDALGQFRFALAYSYNKTNITHVKSNPAALQSLGPTYILFGRQAQADFTETTPRSTVAFDTNWRKNPFGLNLRVKRYGSYTEPGPIQAADISYGAKWITDVSASYQLNKYVNLTIGADNLFDVHPDKVGVVNNNGWGAYGRLSPFGSLGGYYYTRIGLSF